MFPKSSTDFQILFSLFRYPLSSGKRHKYNLKKNILFFIKTKLFFSLFILLVIFIMFFFFVSPLLCWKTIMELFVFHETVLPRTSSSLDYDFVDVQDGQENLFQLCSIFCFPHWAAIGRSENGQPIRTAYSRLPQV